MQKKQGRIIFYPMKFTPDEETKIYLKNIQKEIQQMHMGISVQEKFNEYNILLRKQAMANKLRATLHILK